jgi:LemA protein
MDHMGDWMLSGAALALLVIAGIVLVGLDDIVMAHLRLRRKGSDPAAGDTEGEAPGRDPHRRLTGYAGRAWRRVRPQRSSAAMPESATASREAPPRSQSRRIGRSVRIVLLVPLLSLVLSGCGINSIPTYEEQAKAKWSDVLNQYQRRNDLIPNLVETVKGFAQQERTVLEAVTAARASATAIHVDASTITDPEAFKKFQEAQAQLSGALGRLLAVSENYPDLKSNQNFLALQSQLEGTENRIAVARRDYIEAVRLYNTEMITFPGRIWAWFLYSGNKPMEEFTVDENVKRVPQVKFN